MGRHPRYTPPNALVEVTNRTIQGRMLLRPSKALNQVALGVLGRAQRRYQIPIHAVVFMSNHYHLLASPPNAQRFSEFMCYLNTNLSKEIGRLHDWTGPMWHRRYDQVLVSDEEAAQVERLSYLLAHGSKEHLVDSPKDWPGIHFAKAILKQTPLEGLWFDRSKERALEGQRSNVKADFTEKETVILTPLPAWKHLAPKDYQRRVQEIVLGIEENAAAARSRSTRPSKGEKAVMKGHPHQRPTHLSSSPRPLFHAASKKARLDLRNRFREWLHRYRTASELWRSRDHATNFPPWSFPPPLLWIGDQDVSESG